MFDDFLPIPDAESLPFYPLVLKLVVCAIRSATGPVLLTDLRAYILINDTVPALDSARNGWAVASLYLNDASICKDVATLVAYWH